MMGWEQGYSDKGGEGSDTDITQNGGEQHHVHAAYNVRVVINLNIAFRRHIRLVKTVHI